MRRSRVSLLVAVAGVAGCSRRDDSERIKVLSRDSTLAAQLGTHKKADQPALPDVCATIVIAAQQPSVVNGPRAAELARQARQAEILGNVQEARSLFRQAAELDGTDKSAAYHLGRTNEALGDRSSAITAYCHYLALGPSTAESADVRDRVTKLSEVEANASNRAVASNVSHGLPTRRRVSSATTRRVTRQQPTVMPRALATEAAAEQSARAALPERRTRSTSTDAGGTVDSPTRRDTITDAPKVDGRAADSAAVADDGVAVLRPVPAAEQPPLQRTERRGPTQAQSAGIGAVTGAIIGAATGRSVKSAAIGAAAGGILGTVVGRRVRPVGIH